MISYNNPTNAVLGLGFIFIVAVGVTVGMLMSEHSKKSMRYLKLHALSNLL